MLHTSLHPAERTPAVRPTLPDASTDVGETSLLARLDELRRQILLAVSSLLVVFTFSFSQSEQLVGFVMGPVREALPEHAILMATKIPEIFLLHVRVSLAAAVVLVLPLWLYQIWSFLESVFLREHEGVFAPILALGVTLFGLGAAFGHFVLFPFGVRFLTTFGSDTVHVMLSVGDLFSMYCRFVIGIGAAFQVPTIVYVLSRLGLVTPRLLIGWWKPVVVAAFGLAAVVTPTPDVVTQSLLAVPLVCLYGVSIALCWLVRRRR